MPSGNELFSTSSVSYTNLVGWIMVIVISTILLISRRKKETDIYIKMNYASIVIAVSMILFEVFLR